MSDATSIRMSLRARNTLLAKCFLILLLSWLSGRALAKDVAADYARGEALTLEEYTAGYEAYRAELMSVDMPPAAGIIVFGVVVGGILVLYELAGAGFGMLIGKMFPPSEEGPDEQATSPPGA